MMPASGAISFLVPGTPIPQGSKRGFYNKRTQRVQIVDADRNGLAEWRMKVTAYARDGATVLGYPVPIEGPVGVRIAFILPRPQSHYGTGKNAKTLKPSAPRYPAKMPDIDKLVRAILDGITDAGLWLDDGQVIWIKATKEYVGVAGIMHPSCRVELGPMP